MRIKTPDHSFDTSEVILIDRFSANHVRVFIPSDDPYQYHVIEVKGPQAKKCWQRVKRTSKVVRAKAI